MPRVSYQQTNFTAGEISPRVIGQTNFEKYANGAALMINAHPVLHGGAMRRAGSKYVGTAMTATAGGSILVPFVVGRDHAWMLEFGNLSVKVFDTAGTLVTTLVTPYSDSTLADLDYAQSDATMYLMHPDSPVQRIQRLGSGTWVLSACPFTQQPFAEIGYRVAKIGTLSLATVGAGRTLTVASSEFLASDVGRAVIYEGGIAVITAYTSDVNVTVEITRAFASVTLPTGLWTIESSPQTTCTPSAKDPVGATTTLTLAAAGWRAADVGSMVRINGGLCKITAYTSDTIVDAVIVRVLETTTAASALAWSLEPTVWGFYYGYPRTGTVYQQRLVLGGNSLYPRTVWGSRTGEPLDFTLGTADDSAFAFTIDSDESSPIAYVAGDADLLILTESAEYSMRSGVEKAITPTNVRIKPENNAGSAQVRPVTVKAETLFIQRAGRKVRSLGYSYNIDRYASPDLTVLAEHITTGGVVSMCYQQEPESLLWAARDDGTLLSCTIEREQQVVGWSRHYTSGSVESVATIPNAGHDDVWMIVRRYINGATVRYREILNDSFAPLLPGAAPAADEFPPYTEPDVYGFTVDCGLSFDNAGGQTVFAVPHLIGETVDILADGVVKSQQVVPGSGNVTLSAAAYRTLIGLPFRSQITPLAPEIGTGTGTAQGNSMRTAELTLRLLNTVGGKVMDAEGNEQRLPSRAMGAAVLDQPPEARTGLARIELLGWARGSSTLSIVQDQPLPLHVLALIRKLTVND